jgi:hypothetical protein
VPSGSGGPPAGSAERFAVNSVPRGEAQPFGAAPTRPDLDVPCTESHQPITMPPVPGFASRAHMTHSASASGLNLSIHREPVSVWERPGWDGSRERIAITRWLLGVGGGALALEGLRRRSVSGALLTCAGGSLAWWALVKQGNLEDARHRVHLLLERVGWLREDRVHDESEQSFPASDAPSWTPTVGTGLRHQGRR